MLHNQVVWITGASSGIGEAVARQLARTGSKLILSSRSEDKLQAVKQACITSGANSEDIMVLPVDLEKQGDFPDALEAVINRYKKIDLLFNNAGISQRSLCKETELSVYRTLFEVDFFGQIALTKLVLASMLINNAGHLVVTSSVAGKLGVPYRTGYCAAKHGSVASSYSGSNKSHFLSLLFCQGIEQLSGSF